MGSGESRQASSSPQPQPPRNIVVRETSSPTHRRRILLGLHRFSGSRGKRGGTANGVKTEAFELHVEAKIEVYDVWRSTRNNKLVFRWRTARVRDIDTNTARVFVAFDGFSERWDMWIPLEEGKIRSVTNKGPVSCNGEIFYPIETVSSQPAPDVTIPDHPQIPSSLPSSSSVPPPNVIRTQQQSVLSHERMRQHTTVNGTMTPTATSTSLSSSPLPVPVTPSQIQIVESVEPSSDDASPESDDDDDDDVVVRRPGHQDEDTSESRASSESIAESPASPYDTIHRDGTNNSGGPIATSQLTTSNGSNNNRSIAPWSATGYDAHLAFAHTLTSPPTTTATTTTTSHRGGRQDSLSFFSRLVLSGHGNVVAQQNTAPVVAPPPASIPTRDIPNSASRGISGLQNLGNTCYLNAILQALSHIEPFAAYFAGEEFELDLALIDGRRQGLIKRHVESEVHMLPEQMAHLVCEQWSSNPSPSRKPSAIKRILGELSPQFFGWRQQDAQEALVKLLDSLHTTLNRISRRPTYVELDPASTLTDAQLSSLYWSNYERGNDSFIKDLFVGQFMSRISCPSCGNSSTTFDTFYEINLSVPSTDSHLTNVVNSFFEVESIPNDCAKCGSKHRNKQLSVSRFPTILCLHLKRFMTVGATADNSLIIKKVTSVVRFPLRGMRLFSSGSEGTNVGGNGPLYDLCASVNHSGSFAGGHYTCDAWNWIHKKWLSCDDDQVRPIPPSGIVGLGAYLLFYKKRVEKVNDGNGLRR